MKTGIALVAGVAAGAAAQYFLDKDAGARRRNTMRDQAMARARRQARDASAKAEYAAHQAKGKVASMKPTSGDRKLDDLGDAALARKVESEIFRAEDAPKGKVDVNAENGVVFLRGEVEQDWIERLERDAEQVTGVKAVRNLLHPPGTPAPTAPSPERTSIH